MVAALAERAAAFGVGRVSLNFAMFREAFERGAEVGAGPIARAVAAGPAAGQPHLAAGVAVPLERQVPAGVAAALHLLRVRLRPAPGRHGGGQRGGVPDAPVAGRAAPPGRRADAAVGCTARTPTTLPQVTAQIPPTPDPLAEARGRRSGCPSRCGCAATKLDRIRERGHRPLPGRLPAHAHPGRRSAREAGELPPDTRHRGRVSVAGRVMLKRDGGKLVLRHPARRYRRPAGDGRRSRRSARRRSTLLEARHRPGRPRRRHRRGDHHAARRAVGARRARSRSPASRCGRCRRSTRA